MEEKKISQQIGDVRSDNVKKLASLFPTVVKDGEVDFQALKEELGEFTEVSYEKYELTWAGKKEAKKIAKESSVGNTLKYMSENSINPEKAENLYIEGDNLEVLKLLRENYYSGIKMIYIDPPYNTGGDYVYEDSFKMNKYESDIEEGVVDELGERFSVNRMSSNRFHSRWLSMMYSRLYVAKDLLADNGVIFISIDDNEEHNLREICDEIFGLDNYINTISIKTKASAGASGGGEDKRLKKNAEYILIYSKNKNLMEMNQPVKYTRISDYIDNHKRTGTGFYYTRILEDFGERKLLCEVDDMKVYQHTGFSFSNVSQKMKEENLSCDQAYEKYFDRIFMVTNAQTSLLSKVNDVTPDEQMLMSYEYVPKTGKDKGKKISKYIWNKTLVVWFADSAIKNKDGVYKAEQIGTLWNDISWGRLDLQGRVPFKNGKKPLALLERLIEMGTNGNDVVLDFFSGSGTTGEAVLSSNIKKNLQNKFILVQIPEMIDEKSDEGKQGYKTISELGRQRMIYFWDDNEGAKDYGVKTFALADTNIKWNNLINLGQLDITQIETNPDSLDFMPDSKDEDIVYELILRQRDVPLSEKLERLTVIGERTYLYADSYLVCLENKITEVMVDKLAELNPVPVKFIFRDSSFGDDIALKDETFRRLKAVIDKNAGGAKVSYTVEFI